MAEKSQNNVKNGDALPSPVTVYEFPYMRKPKEKSSIWRKIYNKDKNYFFGRTPKSWGMYFTLIF